MPDTKKKLRASTGSALQLAWRSAIRGELAPRRLEVAAEARLRETRARGELARVNRERRARALTPDPASLRQDFHFWERVVLDWAKLVDEIPIFFGSTPGVTRKNKISQCNSIHSYSVRV